MKLRFAAAARRELNEAALWLELQEPGLGERFLLEVAQAPTDTGISQRLASDVAVAHDRQKPEYWRDRVD